MRTVSNSISADANKTLFMLSLSKHELVEARTPAMQAWK
jgi:hypothetical protein